MLTDGDTVFGSTDAETAAVLQGDLCPGGDALAVDEGAVAGAFVYEDQELAAILQRAVPAADGGGALRETDLTAGVTADGDLACCIVFLFNDIISPVRQILNTIPPRINIFYLTYKQFVPDAGSIGDVHAG